jgi:hypothetical protein
LCTRGFLVLSLVGLSGAGCILPDRDIVIEGEFANRGAVRLVERFEFGEAVNDECGLEAGLSSCPLPPDALHPGLLRDDFCICPLVDSFDQNALTSFNIFVEDPDRDPDGAPQDEIRGALVLDLDPFQDDVKDRVAYRDYLDPQRPAEPDTNSIYKNVIERPDPQLRVLKVFDTATGRVDLCNPPGGSLTPDIHTIHVIVTDRDWYTPIGTDGQPGNQQDGIPNLPAGATYDTAVYTFNCGEGESCNCSTPGS